MKLKQIAISVLIGIGSTTAAYATDLVANDNTNKIQGIDISYMYSLDNGANWRAYESERDNNFPGKVTVELAKVDKKLLSSSTWETGESYGKPDTIVRHNGFYWTNGWWANPGEEPGVNGVWKKGEKILLEDYKKFDFTPFTGQAAIDYQTKIKNEIASKRKVIGYFPEWGVYDAHDNFTPDKVAWDQISHLNYGFAVVTKEGVVEVHDTYKGPGLMRDIAQRTARANVSNMISIGGYTNSQLCVLYCDDAENALNVFEAATATPAGVERLANSIVAHTEQWGFDGVDIDWEYPTTEKAGAQFTSLVQSLRTKLDALGIKKDKYYQLTAAVTANYANIPYINPKVTAPLLDTVNVMTYDYHGAFDNITGHNSPLYANSKDVNQKFNIDSTMKEYNLVYGVPKEKLLVGLSWYGRAWGNVANKEIVSGLPGFLNPGEAAVHGQWDNKDELNGVNPYYVVKNKSLSQQYQRFWDEQAKVPYLLSTAAGSKGEFHSYDDVESITGKVNYIKKEGYGGAIIWELSGDTADHELGSISATLLKQDEGVQLNVLREPKGKIAVEVTLDTKTFKANKRIMFYVDGKYVGETYAGTAYYADKSFNEFNRTVTVKTYTSHVQNIKPGSEVKVVLATGKPGWVHRSDVLLAKLNVTKDMLK
ncbi:hypothetical protein NG99_26290 [Erwinia typographi]|uniref:chitinase n=1 Tax=Erwinia typographi TaxID=371042 RepID=A0A0A3YLH6_9GAMM|nr:glycoside hydrolase family 18 protein [Erwinia typographi]KGT86196.1 hypothetical protein NG99_26290 [Erwinia typographi]